MADCAPGVGGEYVGGVLDPWRAVVEGVVDGGKWCVFEGCEGDVLASDAVYNDRDG